MEQNLVTIWCGNHFDDDRDRIGATLFIGDSERGIVVHSLLTNRLTVRRANELVEAWKAEATKLNATVSVLPGAKEFLLTGDLS